MTNRHIGEPHDHKSGGLEPLGPIGVYAYACCDENFAMHNDRISGHFNRNTVENLLLIIIAIISSCVVNRHQLLGLLSQPGLHGASRVLIVDGVSEADSEIGHVRPSVHPFADILSVEATDL